MENSHGYKFLRYVKRYFLHYFRQKKILDTGAYNFNLVHMFDNCTFYSSDMTNDNSIKRELVSYQKKPFADKTFDMIISIECLENDEYCENSIPNLYDMLNGDGLLIIVIKNIEPHSLDIHKLNKLLHFNKNFSYWNCYQTIDGKLLFIGMKIYVLLELPLLPPSYDVFAKENYNEMIVSIKNEIEG